MNRQHTCALLSLPPSRLPLARDEAAPAATRLKLRLALEIEAMRAKGVTAFLCGLAPGPELWAAELVLDLKRAYPSDALRLIAVIPYAGQAARFGERDRRRCRAALLGADETVVLRPSYAPRCLLQCSRFMVNQSAHMITVYDGEGGDMKHAVEYAHRSELDVVVVRTRSSS